MNAERKPVGTKTRIRAEKGRERRIATAIFLVIILFCVAFSAYFVYTILSSSSAGSSPDLGFIKPTRQFNPENPNPELKAVIVDQLSLTFPNQAFIQAAVNILEGANYSIDYYAGEKVTVEFYRNLPAHGYKVILLRVHSAGHTFFGAENLQLFTSETYSSNKHVTEQLAGQVGRVKYNLEDEIAYFGIPHNFVQQCMNSSFRNTVIIAMGCDGLNGTQMASAFIEKGANTYVGWDGSVTSEHTDEATTHLLQHLVSDDETIRQAVESTMSDVGPDPQYHSQLNYYPRMPD